MKLSEKWLREWVDPKIDVINLSNQIINTGIEIESINKITPLFHGVIVGKIVSCIIHPILNRLKIVKVDVGKKNLLNILCNAINCRNKIKVAVATVGSILANNIEINSKKFLDAISEGMLCSFSELGLLFDKKDNKIIELPANTPVGININDYLLLDDNILKVNITPNRPDGLSILGLSRNIAIMNNMKAIQLPKINNIITIQDQFPIYLNTEKKNINFFARVINNTNVNIDTPFWMKKKLFFCEMLSENIITNIINYVLIEIGQPLNILNADFIDNFIQIQQLNKTQIFNTNNYGKLKLDQNILVFSDKSKILFIPGNINSDILEINQNTKNIFLVAHSIDRESIINIINKIGSNKILDYYNHGIDYSLQKYAIEYATYLILDICGGNAGHITSHLNYSHCQSIKKIKLYFKNINKIAGFLIDSEIVLNILLNLQYKVLQQKDYLIITPPNWRFDILIEEDVIGDILRIYGYDNIPLIPLKENINIDFVNEKKQNFNKTNILKKIVTFLIHQGYYEVINYPFVEPVFHNNISIEDNKKLFITNPISQDLSCLRISLWPGLLKTLTYNQNRQQDSMRFFEYGLCFLKDHKATLGVNQTIFLGGVISGFDNQENWLSKRRKLDFYDIKGNVEIILKLICNTSNWEIKNKPVLGLHPNQSAQIFLNDKFVGNIGKIDPILAIKLDLNNHNTFLFELFIEKILNLKYLKDFKVKEISKFPISRRDISMLIAEDIPYSDIIKVCNNCFLNNKVNINLFDIYLSKQFSNKKSLGISFIFQDSKKTLKESEINLMLDNCIRTLIEKFQIILRK